MTGSRQLLPESGRVLSLAATLVVVLLQALALSLAAPFVTSVSTSIAELVSLLGLEERPSLASALPLATRLATDVGIVVGAGAVATAVAAVVLSIWRRRVARGRPRGLRLTLGERAAAVGLVAGAALVSLVLTIVGGALVAPLEIIEARGTLITVVLPTPALIVSVLIVVSVTVVLGSMFVSQLLRAWSAAPVRQTLVVDATHLPALAGQPYRRSLPGGLTVAVVALTAAFVLLAALARPISDDLRIMSLVRDLGFWEYMARHLALETGRYSQGISNWILVTVFGSTVNLGTALVVFVAVLSASALALTTFLPRLRESGHGTVWWLAGGFAVVSVYLVPSPFDTWLWFTSADVYMPSVAGLLFSAVLVRRVWVYRRSGWRRTALVVATLAVVALTQGYSEATSVLGWVCATALIVVAFRKHDPYPRIISLLVWGTATLGLLVLAFAPAQQIRSESVDSGSLVVGVLGGLYSLLPLGATLGLHGWLLIMGVAIAFALALRPLATRRELTVMAAVGAASLTLVPPMGGLVAFLGLNWVPWRTLTLPAMAFAWGVVLLLSAAIVFVLRWGEAHVTGSGLRPRAVPRAVSVATLTLIAATIATGPLIERAVIASVLRAQLTAARDVVVVEQIAAGVSEIAVHPSPLLFYPSDTRDFEFLEVQNKDWFSAGYRTWFGVPASATLVYETQQPLGYCVDDARVMLPGVTPCSGNDADDDE